MNWTLLVTTLPTENSTARMRAWRALKQTGAAVLRDGVYLMPPHPSAIDSLNAIADDVRQNGGSAWLLPTESQDGFPTLFDRSPEFGELLPLIAAIRPAAETLPEASKQTRKLRKSFDQLAAIDFFPGEAQRQAAERLQELELSLARVASPDEPAPALHAIPCLRIADYQGRLWATRARPWVDRLARRLARSAVSLIQMPVFCGWPVRRIVRPMPWALILTGRRSRMWARASPSRPCWRRLIWKRPPCCGWAQLCISWMRAAHNRRKRRGSSASSPGCALH